MSDYLTELIDEDIDSRYFRLHEPLLYFSDNLNALITVPVGFVYDHESVPIIKGTSNRGGCIHDYLCRYNNEYHEAVDKKRAAEIYLEAMECRDKYIGDSFDRMMRRWIKSRWVKYWPSKFFHLSKVEASYEEIKDR